MKQLLLLASVATSLIVGVNSARADAAVYEGFDYTSGSDITTLPGTGTGFTGGWFSSTGGILGFTDSTGLDFGSLATSGGSLDVTSGGGNSWFFLSRSLGTTIANTDTLYESFLFQYNGAGAMGSGDNFGISAGDTSGNDHTMGILPRNYNGATTGRVTFSDGVRTDMTYTNGGVTDGNTYLFIGKWTNLGGASTATGWALSLSNFNAISGSPITEADLNANNVATATVNGTAGSFGT
ncbi:MAG: hypothetical protein ACREKL_05160, partial [Chthoniobacterales bacterium]